jgi:hypothetical protein
MLALIPGAECAFPEWYTRKIADNSFEQTRWEAAADADLVLQLTAWQTLRFLITLTPDTYYSVCLVWDDASGQFKSYYINFELPYRRSHCGFDTYDLELDLVVDRDWNIRWKDEVEYQEGIHTGGILQSWAASIAASRPGILEKIKKRCYPFDGSWVDWSPDPSWRPPSLPPEWQTV